MTAESASSSSQASGFSATGASKQRDRRLHSLSSMSIARATEATDELLAAFERLVPQLTRTSPPPTMAELTELVSARGTHLLVARDPDIVGVLTLVIYRIPTCLKASIEDVIVDEAARGRGVG